MERVIWTKRSLASLRKIWESYSEKDAILADRIIEEIISTIENIQFAKQYQIEERLSKNHRRAIVRHFKIIYLANKDEIQVLTVFDTRQNPGKLK